MSIASLGTRRAFVASILRIGPTLRTLISHATYCKMNVGDAWEDPESYTRSHRRWDESGLNETCYQKESLNSAKNIQHETNNVTQGQNVCVCVRCVFNRTQVATINHSNHKQGAHGGSNGLAFRLTAVEITKISSQGHV